MHPLARRNDAGWRTLPADVKFYNNLASGVLEYCALNNIDPLQLDFEYDDANGQVALDLYRTTVGLGAFFHVMFTDLVSHSTSHSTFVAAGPDIGIGYCAGYMTRAHATFKHTT